MGDVDPSYVFLPLSVPHHAYDHDRYQDALVAGGGLDGHLLAALAYWQHKDGILCEMSLYIILA